MAGAVGRVDFDDEGPLPGSVLTEGPGFARVTGWRVDLGFEGFASTLRVLAAEERVVIGLGLSALTGVTVVDLVDVAGAPLEEAPGTAR